MKEITVECQANGRAIVKTNDMHFDLENKASILKIDFSDSGYPDDPKWVDIVVGSKSMRYELGDDQEVSIELEYPVMLPGEMIITPFIYDGVRKVKFKPNHSVVVMVQQEAGSESSITRDDYIFKLKEQVDEWDCYYSKIAELLEGDTLDINQLENFDFIHIQVYDSETDRLNPVAFMITSDVPTFKITEMIRSESDSSGYREAVISISQTSLTFDTEDINSIESRIGAKAYVYGKKIRRETPLE